MLTCCCRVAIIVRSCSFLVWWGVDVEGVSCCGWDMLYGGGGGDGEGEGGADDLYLDDSCSRATN